VCAAHLLLVVLIWSCRAAIDIKQLKRHRLQKQTGAASRRRHAQAVSSENELAHAVCMIVAAAGALTITEAPCDSSAAVTPGFSGSCEPCCHELHHLIRH
jgi:hypothetical protein